MTSPDTRTLEQQSSAVTLSDMEVFIFPELIYSLVLANLMSPRLWTWRDEPWFDGIEKLTPYRRVVRLKQYIMDHYTFNLDLDTWGLTTKERELARFTDFMDPDTLAQSNALFGYEGDKYYFDSDIRTHFGLDQYTRQTLPYWKTETVEAMDAFRFKPNYGTGAGECVSLSTLYAAALFLVARIPLTDIFLMATPLHSQNFIDVDDGILTNNRRLVTKTMWFNGTALSAQARRALENERVTLVAHETGCIHTVYPDATIAPDAYARFDQRLRRYLETPLTEEILGNFLRHQRVFQSCFQLRWPLHNGDGYIGMERVYAYEHNSPYRFTGKTRDKLMAEIDREEFSRCSHALGDRILFNDLEAVVRENRLNIHDPVDAGRLKQRFSSECLGTRHMGDELARFCRTQPRLPDPNTKTFHADQEPLALQPDMTRPELIARLESIRDRNEMANLAFYAYRDLNRTDAGPFVKAAMERNPVSVQATRDLDTEQVVEIIRAMPDTSIYDEPGRLAQPDEVWNFRTGDGAEKTLLLANILKARSPNIAMTAQLLPDRASVLTDRREYVFPSSKQLTQRTVPL